MVITRILGVHPYMCILHRLSDYIVSGGGTGPSLKHNQNRH